MSKPIYPSGHDCVDILQGGDLLTSSSAKIIKSNEFDNVHYNVVMYLAPSDLSGHNLCAHASGICILLCLNTAGRASFDVKIPKARLRRATLFNTCKICFLIRLDYELAREARKAARLERKLCVRLNGTSDVCWEFIAQRLMAKYSNAIWYDYTKYPYHTRPSDKLPANYSLTYSFSENTTAKQLAENLDNGRNVAVVFSRSKRTEHNLPSVWNGTPVINGDLHDMRFLDAPSHIVGLLAKGQALGKVNGFVIDATAPVALAA